MITDISTPATLGIEKNDPLAAFLSKKIHKLNALACSNFNHDSFDMTKAENESLSSIKALDATTGLQEMLAAQMLSIHRLQQISIAMANETLHRNSSGQYFANTAIKLANAFVQQANLLSRLQGNGTQRIIIERVDIHSGGQAVVGVVTPTAREEK